MIFFKAKGWRKWLPESMRRKMCVKEISKAHSTNHAWSIAEKWGYTMRVPQPGWGTPSFFIRDDTNKGIEK